MGFLESLISIGSLRESLPYYCIPEFTEEPVLEIVDAYHPELSEPVPNSVKAERGIPVSYTHLDVYKRQILDYQIGQ